MTDDGFRIGELVDRKVYVQKKHVGTIVGERYHPNEERVSSMRIQVAPDVAEEFMRKPAEFAALQGIVAQHTERWLSEVIEIDAGTPEEVEKHRENR